MGTNLDDILKSYTIKYAVYTGVATNVCVESTLRDGYFLGYWPIIVSDAVNNAGPPATQQATLWNVENLFGWVTSTADFVKSLSAQVEWNSTACLPGRAEQNLPGLYYSRRRKCSWKGV